MIDLCSGSQLTILDTRIGIPQRGYLQNPLAYQIMFTYVACCAPIVIDKKLAKNLKKTRKGIINETFRITTSSQDSTIMLQRSSQLFLLEKTLLDF